MNLNNLSGCNIIGLASSISILLGENLTAEETALLAAFVVTLGDNLAILATTKAIEEEQNKKKEEK